jgi:hypothetical protein
MTTKSQTAAQPYADDISPGETEMKIKTHSRPRPLRSIRTKLLITLLASLGPLIAASLVSGLYARKPLEGAIGSNMMFAASQAADETDALLTRDVQEAQRLASASFTLREEVERANLRYEGMSGSDILKEMEEMDRRWIDSKPEDEFIRQYLQDRAALRLKSHQQSDPDRFSEIFVTDREGALVGATNKTSDYYQAGEGAWIFVCEGEKDVDNVRALGLTATCNSGGAGKWQHLADDSPLHGRQSGNLYTTRFKMPNISRGD